MSKEVKNITANYMQYGLKMDSFTIERDYEGINALLMEMKNLITDEGSIEFAPVFYFIGTGYSVLCDHERESDRSMQNIDANKYRKLSLYYFRKAIALFEKCEPRPDMILSVYTNYANALDSCGRVIEALSVYRKAIDFYPKFGMAVGNYGRALEFYANMVNDGGQYKDLYCHAYQALRGALLCRDANMHEDAICYFERKVNEYQEKFNSDVLKETITYPENDLGCAEEKDYRLWCLRNHLFLNPHNDLIEIESAFAHDPLTITQFREDAKRENKDGREGEPPRWFAMLNQLKEEYAYSRYLCFECTRYKDKVHFADKEVKLSLSSFEYTNYSIRIEQIKSAYKTLFSIFDQIGYFINDFFQIGFKERDASADRVFKSPKYPMDNVAMAALFWCYCEFSEKYGEADNPSEKDLKILRNALEHKFVKVHEYPYNKKLELEEDNFYHISEEDLISQTIRMLQLAREWIMELVYAIGIEERKKGTSDNVIHLDIIDFDDEWKR